MAAYALGALEPAESEAFLRHLDTCSVCRDELASFQQVVDTLPMTVPAHRAPRGLRRRVLRAVEADPRPALGGARPADARPQRARRRVPRPALVFAAMLAMAVGAVVAVSLSTSSGPGTRVIHATVTGRGTAVLKIARGQGELIVHRLSPPPAGKIYQVWVQRGHAAPTPTTALFGVTAAGNAQVAVPGRLRGVSLVMVTPEPAGGSKAPTHAPVITAPLT